MNTSNARNKLAAARFRAEACSRIRAFFAARDVLEVETPLLSRGASHDFHIDLFIVPIESEKSIRFLQTSPEPHMKRLLARGYPDIFQIGKAFRSGDIGSRHNPEFTMVEWYRREFSLKQMMEETAELCRLVVGPVPCVFTSYEEMFSTATGMNPMTASFEKLASHPVVSQRGLSGSDFPEASDVLNFLMSELVEPDLDPKVLTLVHGFPSILVSQALSDPEHPGTSLRFEVFGGGMELGNGYQELKDSAEYRRRFEGENRKRQAAGKPTPPLNEEWFADIGPQLPACSGVAIGLDRLIQTGFGAGSLGEILEFPWKNS